jgi:hypothetical protein
MPWTRFVDNRDCDDDGIPRYVYIEAPEDQAVEIFEQIFDINPRLTPCCEDCGHAFKTFEGDTIEEAAGELRDSTKDHFLRTNVRIIRKTEFDTLTPVPTKEDRAVAKARNNNLEKLESASIRLTGLVQNPDPASATWRKLVDEALKTICTIAKGGVDKEP